MKQEHRKTLYAMLWLILSCALHMILFKNKLDPDMPLTRRIPFVLLGIAITLPLHEVIHCVFMRSFGLKNTTIAFGRDPLGLPSLHTVAQGELCGWKRIVTFLSPLLLLTLIPDLLFFLCDRVHLLFFIIAMCNAAGCCFDAAEVLRRGRR